MTNPTSTTVERGQWEWRWKPLRNGEWSVMRVPRLVTCPTCKGEGTRVNAPVGLSSRKYDALLWSGRLQTWVCEDCQGVGKTSPLTAASGQWVKMPSW